MNRSPFIALAAAAVVAAVAAPGRAQPPVTGLCGVSPVIDSLLGCASTTGSNPNPPPASGSQATTTTVAPALPPAPPVTRSPTRPQYVPNVLLVRFRSDGPRATALLRRLKIRTERRIPQLHERALFVPERNRTAVLKALRHSPLVTSIGRDEVLHTMAVTTNDMWFGWQWGLRLARFTTAWEEVRGASIVVAVLDTGVNSSQPDLRPGNCSILPIKVMGANGTGDLATVADGIVRATDLGARIINLSLGGPVGLDVLQQAIGYANSKGVVVVAAAGNSGVSLPQYPAAYPGVISVAATDPSDRLYPWSEYGPWVSVGAPGCNVAPVFSGGYGEFCGTSSATPLVAGLAALVLSAQPTATPTQVATAIERSAKHIDAVLANGRIDAAAALAPLTRTILPPIRITNWLTGVLTTAARSRSYIRTIGGGSVIATLRSRGTGALSLTLVDSLGQRISRSGRTPIVLRRQLAAGSLRVAIHGKRHGRMAYTLILSYLAKP